MSSNALTVDQPVESIKKFKFYTENSKDEIEISIPEVNGKKFQNFLKSIHIQCLDSINMEYNA